MKLRLLQPPAKNPTGVGAIALHWCPGCGSLHILNYEKPVDGELWEFNGNEERPTFLCYNKAQELHKGPRCLYSIVNGIIRYDRRSSHALAGTDVELPDIPDNELAGLFEGSSK